MKLEKKHLQIILTVTLSVAICAMFIYILFYGQIPFKGVYDRFVKILMPVITGLIVTYILSVALNFIERRCLLTLIIKYSKKPLTSRTYRRVRLYSIIITELLLVVVFYLLLSVTLPSVGHSIQNIVTQFPTYLSNLNDWIMDILSKNPDIEINVMGLLDTYSEEVDSWLNTNILPQANNIMKNVTNGVFGLFSAFWNFILGVFLSIYLLFNKETLTAQSKKLIYALWKKENADAILSTISYTDKTFSKFLSGNILDALLVGILCFIGTLLMGAPYPALISLIVGITNLIPLFGPFIGGIPSVLLILMAKPEIAIWFAVFLLVLQQIDGNFIKTRILGDSLGLSGFWVIVSITVFGGLFGTVGMFFGVPAFAVIYTGVSRFAYNRLKQKGLPPDTNTYLIPVSKHMDTIKDKIKDKHKVKNNSKNNNKTSNKNNNNNNN